MHCSQLIIGQNLTMEPGHILRLLKTRVKTGHSYIKLITNYSSVALNILKGGNFYSILALAPVGPHGTAKYFYLSHLMLHSSTLKHRLSASCSNVAPCQAGPLNQLQHKRAILNKT